VDRCWSGGCFSLEVFSKPLSGCRRWLTLLDGIVMVISELRTRCVSNVGIKYPKDAGSQARRKM
jgi:hypothetical protein